MSPTTISLTPPSGFWSAVSRPSLMASRMVCGTCPTESKLATCVSSSDATSLSKTGKRWSDVMPDGPAAAPRRALLKQTRNSTESSSNCSAGWSSATTLLRSSLGSGGRFESCHCPWCHRRIEGLVMLRTTHPCGQGTMRVQLACHRHHSVDDASCGRTVPAPSLRNKHLLRTTPTMHPAGRQ